MAVEIQQHVYNLLAQMPTAGLAAAKQLFWIELNYDRADKYLSRSGFLGSFSQDNGQ